MKQVGRTVRHDNEIDLHELFSGLWAERLVILLVTLVVGGCATAYAFLATPYYEAKVVLHPAAISDLDELNSTQIIQLTPEDTLKRAGAALESYENRLAFALAHEADLKILQQDGRNFEQAFALFNERSIKVLLPDPKKADGLSPFVGFSVTYPKGFDGVTLTNAFVEFAITQERKKIETDLRVAVENKLSFLEQKTQAARASYEAQKDARIAKLLEEDSLQGARLNDELNALREQLRTHRNDRIAQLDEAIRIATSLGIHKPTNPTSLGEVSRVEQGNVIRTEVNNQQAPLYFMGTEALESERKALLERRSDDFTSPRIAEIQKELRLLKNNRQVETLKQRQNEDLFLNNLADLREEAARLRKLKVDFPHLALVKIDQQAIEPISPVKPQKALVLAIGVVLGGLLGVFIALIRRMIRKVHPAAHIAVSLG